jgi:hypothetical protein
VSGTVDRFYAASSEADGNLFTIIDTIAVIARFYGDYNSPELFIGIFFSD